MDAIVLSGADPRLESEIEAGRDSALHVKSAAKADQGIDQYALIVGFDGASTTAATGDEADRWPLGLTGT